MALSSAGPRATRSAAPIAAVAAGRVVVTTGTRRCSDIVVVTTGIAAPPPIEATAARSAAADPGAGHVSCTAATRSANERCTVSSSSARVSRTSPRKPGRSAGTAVAVTVDSRSLAARHSARSRVSDPIAEVPVTSSGPPADNSATTWASRPWSIRSPEKSRRRTVGAIGR